MADTVEELARRLSDDADPRYSNTLNALRSNSPLPDCAQLRQHFAEFCAERPLAVVRAIAVGLLSQPHGLAVIRDTILKNLDLIVHLGPNHTMKMWSLTRLRLGKPELKLGEVKVYVNDEEYLNEDANVFRIRSALCLRGATVCLWLLDAASDKLHLVYGLDINSIRAGLTQATVTSNLTDNSREQISLALARLRFTIDYKVDVPADNARHASPERRVRLLGPGLPVIIDGKEYPKITMTRFRIVTALLAAPDGLSKDELVKRSGSEDAVNTLKRLSKEPGWADVIIMAGEPGKHYHLK